MSESGKAVFLSYASQDAEAARRICDALRAAGIEVWFDQSELRGGDAWDQKIRRQIKECALFVPIISANTNARAEGYFRREWRWAVDRMHDLADDHPFLVPVIIEDTPEGSARVPERFQERQWTRIGGADSLDAFCERVGRLLGDAGALTVHERSDRGTVTAARATLNAGAPRLRRRAALVTLAVVISGTAIFTALRWQGKRNAHADAFLSTGEPRSAEASQLVERAIAITEKLDYTRDELLAAEDMTRRATELEPRWAHAWGVRAWISASQILRGWDREPKRRQDTEAIARRGLALDPEEPDALKAVAEVMLAQGAAKPAEELLRRAVRARPEDRRARERLAGSLGVQGRLDEQRAELNALIQRDPGAVLARYQLALSYGANQANRPSLGQMPANEDVALALEQLDAALAIAPFYSALCLKAQYLAAWRGDLIGMRQALDELEKRPAFERAEDQPLATAMWGALLERKPERVLAVAALTTRPYIEHSPSPKAWYTALARTLAGQENLARIEWQAAEAALRDRLRAQPEAPLEQAQLAVTLAWLGKTDEAKRLIVPLEPMAGETNSIGIVRLNATLAQYYAALGEAAAAVPFLRRALNRRSGGLTDYTLALDPWWDKLRGKPEFEALLDEAAARRSGPRTEDGGRKAEVRKAGVPASHGTREPPDLADLSAVPSAKVDAKSVAVLAFANLSDDAANEYFSDGISEELLNVLAKVPGLKVSARTSAFSFKGKGVAIPEIARQLGVAYVVEGSVRKVGNRVRITAQLIKAADGFHVWSDNFDRELKDIFAVQDEIAGLIAGNLSLKLGAASPAAKAEVNPEAYRLYLEGREAWQQRTETGYARAENLYHRALQLQPGFALAHVGLARVWINRSQDESSIGGFAQIDSPLVARIAGTIERALELDPALPEAHTTLGSLRWMQWRFPDGIREVRLALALNPNDASSHQVLGRILLANGEIEAALGALKQAHELDPLFARIADNYSLALLAAGRHDAALQLAEHALRLQPDSKQALRFKVTALAELGRGAECREAAKQYLAAGPDSTPQFVGYALARVGAREEAEAVLKTAEAIVPREPARAAALLALGRREECLNSFRSAADFMSQEVDLLSWPVFDEVRAEPRFRNLLAALGVTPAHDRAQAWRASLAKASEDTEGGGQRTDKNGLPSVRSAKEGTSK